MTELLAQRMQGSNYAVRGLNRRKATPQISDLRPNIETRPIGCRQQLRECLLLAKTGGGTRPIGCRQQLRNACYLRKRVERPVRLDASNSYGMPATCENGWRDPS